MKGLKPRSLPMIVLLVVAGTVLLAIAAEVVYGASALALGLGVGAMVVLYIAMVVLLAVLDSGGRKMGAAMVAAYAGYIVAVVLLG